MSELRQNVITREWVIITPERSKRPDQFIRGSFEKNETPMTAPDCPFCVGNEEMTLVEKFRISDGINWRVRVVPNKFPALRIKGDRVRNMEGVYRSMTAVGHHEVVIEHPLHNMTLALMKEAEVADVLTAYRQRYAEIKNDDRVEAIIIFKNHGESAGTSLVHPHSQIVATPIVPGQIRNRMDEAIRYFDDTGECVCCRTIRDELKAKERIVCSTNWFVALIPYAALSPFHTWIFPLRHASSFDEMTDLELTDLARCLRTVLAKLYHGLNNPDFNYSIRSIPTREARAEFFHWYLTIVPRVTKAAGFEIGSGMYVNTALPEESADFLRRVDVGE
ncbi:MAG: galactose-1-phosphate uridylyltransferase [Bacteroidetes bacterium]|nr:galactose-1-phosphate uridylyltransferase [Bacteroidota bacterium]